MPRPAKHRRPRPPRDSSGQVVFMAAFAALALMVGLALVARWGAAAVGSARAQNVADAVALAAVADPPPPLSAGAGPDADPTPTVDPAATVARSQNTRDGSPLQVAADISPHADGVLVRVTVAGHTAVAAASAGPIP
ncbi:MAG TPA: hypothetical protein DEP66_04360 [Acidimicrobiaceae bacterium]|nr:hypothetical protein [Acidimicrobiaceae bacterium]